MTQIKTDNIRLAWDHIGVATSFWKSAEVLSAHRQEHNQTGMLYVPALYYLVSHAAELLIKAALLKGGVSEEDIKKYRIRHNLVELQNLLEKNGKTITIPTKEVIQSLNKTHTNHAMRYKLLIKAPAYVLSPEEMFSALEELLMATRLNEG